VDAAEAAGAGWTGQQLRARVSGSVVLAAEAAPVSSIIYVQLPGSQRLPRAALLAVFVQGHPGCDLYTSA
jgi:hypothetical protein